MRQITIFWMALTFLAVSAVLASSDGWTSKASSTQPTGPKFGDYIKNKGNILHPANKPNKQGKKKNPQ